jgi:Ca-activated chloride channel family protein
MTFARPLLLVTLLAVPVLWVLYLLVERRRARYAVRYTNLEVLASVSRVIPWHRYVPPAIFVVALASISVALARPHMRTVVETDNATVILVIDDSGSMQAADVKPTRLAAAQDAVHTFLDRVPSRVRVGLIVFAGEPQVAAPPTTDHALVRAAIDGFGEFPGFGGTAIGDALAAAVQLARRSLPPTTPAPPAVTTGQTIAFNLAAPVPVPAKRPPVSILFLSDGAQTRGNLQPLDGALRAKAAGIPVFTIALGTPGGTLTRTFGGFTRTIAVPPDPATLKAVATTTGGTFFAARSADAVRAAYARLGSQIGRKPGTREVTALFLAVAAALLAGAILLSMLWSPRLP